MGEMSMHLPIFTASSMLKAQTVEGQAEEENIYKCVCHKQGDKMMDGCEDQRYVYGRHHRMIPKSALVLRACRSCHFRHFRKRLPMTDWCIHADSMQSTISLSILPFSSSESSCIGSSFRAKTVSSNWTPRRVKRHWKSDKICVKRGGGY